MLLCALQRDLLAHLPFSPNRDDIRTLADRLNSCIDAARTAEISRDSALRTLAGVSDMRRSEVVAECAALDGIETQASPGAAWADLRAAVERIGRGEVG